MLVHYARRKEKSIRLHFSRSRLDACGNVSRTVEDSTRTEGTDSIPARALNKNVCAVNFDFGGQGVIACIM